MDCSKRFAGVVASLSDDPLVEILSRVPVKSLRRFKCVSKTWRDLIADPLHRKKLPQTLEGFFFMDEEIYGGGGGGGCDGRHIGFMDLVPRSVPLDIDPCFSFLTKLPGIEGEVLTFLDSCSGLLLFEHGRFDVDNLVEVLCYIVCNRATKEWGTVPTCSLKGVLVESGPTCFLIR